jgi:hypothetical protein
MKVDSDGYAVFYPLGTNKIEVPTETSAWPQGNKLISPYVFQDNKLVGFCDTKAMIVSDKTSITLNYEHIEADFSSIEEGMLTITAPNATTKKVTWKNSGVEDIPEAQYKYKGCTTVDSVRTVDANYPATDIVNGVWSEPLWDLTNGKTMFRGCIRLKSFSSDLPSLTDGSSMFNGCINLSSFTSDLPSLTNGYNMFCACERLTSFNVDLPNLTNGG